jgi:hypothetical protein
MRLDFNNEGAKLFRQDLQDSQDRGFVRMVGN